MTSQNRTRCRFRGPISGISHLTVLNCCVVSGVSLVLLVLEVDPPRGDLTVSNVSLVVNDSP